LKSSLKNTIFYTIIKTISLPTSQHQKTHHYVLSSLETLHPKPLQDFLFMHDKPIEDLKQITAIDTNHHHIRKAIALPPFLNDALFSLPSKPSPWTLLHTIIKFIKSYGDSQRPLIIIPEGDEDTEATITDETATPQEPTDWSFADQLLPILISLWAFANHESIPNLDAHHTTDSSSLATNWATKQHEHWYNQNNNTNPPSSYLHTPPRCPSHTDDDISTASSIDKLQDTLDAHARRFAKEADNDNNPLSPPSKSSNSLSKSWKTLDDTFRQAILFASSPDGETAPSSPSERLLRIMQTKTGPTTAARGFCV
jgi:hypothetical protein